jgi:polysaccharide biosynthesis protein PslH
MSYPESLRCERSVTTQLTGAARDVTGTGDTRPPLVWRRMRLLIASTEAPLPPLGGLRQPLRELVLRLRQRHDVDVIAYQWPEQVVEPIDGVRTTYFPVPVRRRFVRAGSFLMASAQRRPLRARELEAPIRFEVEARLARERFDAVHITGLPLATLAPHVRGIPSVMAVLDAWHLNARAEVSTASMLARPLKALEYRNTVSFESATLRHFDRVVTVSGNDAAALTSLDPQIRTSVIPNGVDATFFAPGARSPERHLIVFVGTMSWAPNIEAVQHMARDIMPRVRRVFADARFAVVGRSIAPSVADDLRRYPGVSVIGEVPDVRTWLNRAHAGVCPMVSGTGIKNKLLEAMAAGVPSVATPLACQGIDDLTGREVLVADGADDFASSVLRIFEDETLAEQLATEARSHVMKFHTWEGTAERFEGLYATIARERLGGDDAATGGATDLPASRRRIAGTGRR